MCLISINNKSMNIHCICSLLLVIAHNVIIITLSYFVISKCKLEYFFIKIISLARRPNIKRNFISNDPFLILYNELLGTNEMNSAN